MPNEERGRLDSAIDRAVRGMMQVDPRPGLRHRVAWRLEAPDRPGSWLLPAFASVALCAAVILAIVLVRAPQPPPAAEPQVATAPASAPAAPPAQTETAAPASTPAAPPRVAARPRPAAPQSIFGPRQDRVTAANVSPGDDASAGLASIDTPLDAGAPFEAATPFGLAPIRGGIAPLSLIAIEPIRLQPIAITPVTVSALPDRR